MLYLTFPLFGKRTKKQGVEPTPGMQQSSFFCNAMISKTLLRFLVVMTIIVVICWDCRSSCWFSPCLQEEVASQTLGRSLSSETPTERPVYPAVTVGHTSVQPSSAGINIAWRLKKFEVTKEFFCSRCHRLILVTMRGNGWKQRMNCKPLNRFHSLKFVSSSLVVITVHPAI